MPAPEPLPTPTSDAAQHLLQVVLDRVAGTGLPVTRLDHLLESDVIFKKMMLHVDSFQLGTPAPSMPFVDSLLGFASEHVNKAAEGFGSELLRFSRASRELAKLNDRHNESVSQVLSVPMMLLRSSVCPTELRANLDKAVKHYEKEKLRIAKSKWSAERRQAALETQQRVLQLAAVDYFSQMNSVRDKRSYEFVWHLISLYKAQREYHLACAKALEDSLPDVDALAADVSAGRKSIDAAKIGLIELRQQVEAAVFAAERREQGIKADKTKKPAAESKHRRRSSNPSYHDFPSSPGPREASAAVRAFLDEVNAMPGNQECGDCGQSQPQWAACDVGVLLCDDCAKIHREFTALPSESMVEFLNDLHCKQIRNLARGDMEVADMLMIKAVGNKAANGILEEALTGTPQEATTKPKPTSSHTEKKAFIQNKYKMLAYSPTKDRPGDLVAALREGSYSPRGVASVLLEEMVVRQRLARNQDGTEALHLAVAEGNVLAIDLLLRTGGNPNQKLQSYTPLHVAAQMNRSDCTKVLLRHGANVNARDSLGRTAMDIATSSTSQECADLLDTASGGDMRTIMKVPVKVPDWTGGRPLPPTQGVDPSLRLSDPIYAQIEELQAARAAAPELPARQSSGSGPVGSPLVAKSPKPVPSRPAPPPPGVLAAAKSAAAAGSLSASAQASPSSTAAPSPAAPGPASAPSSASLPSTPSRPAPPTKTPAASPLRPHAAPKPKDLEKSPRERPPPSPRVKPRRMPAAAAGAPSPASPAASTPPKVAPPSPRTKPRRNTTPAGTLEAAASRARGEASSVGGSSPGTGCGGSPEAAPPVVARERSKTDAFGKRPLKRFPLPPPPPAPPEDMEDGLDERNQPSPSPDIDPPLPPPPAAPASPRSLPRPISMLLRDPPDDELPSDEAEA
eukprot:m.7844 g.7844  ORF g.7844 m.7844 type:complete len:909 (+) comp3057_c0_seq1:134-2860(+)